MRQEIEKAKKEKKKLASQYEQMQEKKWNLERKIKNMQEALNREMDLKEFVIDIRQALPDKTSKKKNAKYE